MSTLKNKYTELANSERIIPLDSARLISTFIDPYFYPPEGFDPRQRLPVPLNSKTSMSVNNFTSKILQTMIPANTPFMKINVEVLSLIELQREAEAAGVGLQIFLGELGNTFSRFERAMDNDLKNKNIRKAMAFGLKHLWYAGNTLLKYSKKEKVKVWSLEQFVVEREFDGEVLDIILFEETKFENLDTDIKEMIETKEGLKKENGNIEIYTGVSKEDNGKYREWQELSDGTIIPDTETIYKKKQNPWIVPAINLTYGSNYGVPYLYYLLGHIQSSEGFREDVNKIGEANARVLYGLKPSSAATVREVSSAKSGDVLSMEAEDLNVVSKTASQELNDAAAQLEVLNRELGEALQSFNAIRREGDRVTAEEIRISQEELNKALGTIFIEIESSFIQSVAEISWEYLKEEFVGIDISNKVEINVITGVDAFSRQDDLSNLRALMGDVANLNLLGEVNLSEVVRRLSSGYNIENFSLIKSEKDKDAERQKAMDVQDEVQQRQAAQQIIAGATAQQVQQEIQQ
jgi:hypothetical protein